jgi:hypothetical protein
MRLAQCSSLSSVFHNKMLPSWKEWLKMAEEMEQGLKAYGHVVLRVTCP